MSVWTFVKLAQRRRRKKKLRNQERVKLKISNDNNNKVLKHNFLTKKNRNSLLGRNYTIKFKLIYLLKGWLLQHTSFAKSLQ